MQGKKLVAIRVILTAGSHLYQTKARWLYAITQGINHGVEPSSPFVMLWSFRSQLHKWFISAWFCEGGAVGRSHRWSVEFRLTISSVRSPCVLFSNQMGPAWYVFLEFVILSVTCDGLDPLVSYHNILAINVWNSHGTLSQCFHPEAPLFSVNINHRAHNLNTQLMGCACWGGSNYEVYCWPTLNRAFRRWTLVWSINTLSCLL